MRNQNARKWHKVSWLVGLIAGITLLYSSPLAWAEETQKDVPLKISKETTLITEPLKSNGKEVDYFRAIELMTYPKAMKTDENGYRMIVRAIGVSPDNESPELIAQTYEKLGLDPLIKPTMTFQEPYDFIEEQLRKIPGPSKDVENLARKLEEKLESPWTLKTMPMMADWLKSNGPTLDIISKAAKQPYLIYPKLRKNEKALIISTWSPEALQLRDMAKALQTRANYRIGQGDLDGAIDDIIASKILGCQASHNGSMVDFFIGIPIEWANSSLGIAGNLEHQPTEAQLQKLLDVFTDRSSQKLPARFGYKKTMLVDRYTVLDCVQYLANADAKTRHDEIYTPVKAYGLKIDNMENFSTFDWNIVIKKVKDVHEDPEKTPDLDQLKVDQEKLRSRDYRSKILGDLFAHILRPSSEACQEALNRATCFDRLQAITLAMLIYEKQHGTLPPAWTVDDQDRRLHSWRVLLLPYLGDDAKKLYKKIRLDEPWDSEHNRQFHSAVVPFYQCPSAKLKPGETVYSVVVGKKTAFRGSKGVKLDTFGPHSTNLLLVTERKTAVCWMDPNVEVIEANAKTQIGSKHPDIVNGGFRDGRVVLVRNVIAEGKASNKHGEESDPDTFQKMLDGTAEKMP